MSFQPLGPSIWVQRFPFSVLGAPLGKTTTVIRLGTGELVIHSAAPMGPDAGAEIRALGQPRWLLEGSRMHDTFARSLRAVFPEAIYLLPPRFPFSAEALAPAEKLRAQSLPSAWADEIEIERIKGAPAVEEHVLWHRPSRTLILSYFVFNIALPAGAPVPFFLRWVSGIKAFPATSRLVKWAARDREAVKQSWDRIMAWDFERVVVGHGEIIAPNAKDLLQEALSLVWRD